MQLKHTSQGQGGSPGAANVAPPLPKVYPQQLHGRPESSKAGDCAGARGEDKAASHAGIAFAAVADMHTYEVKGIKHVHVSQQSEALSKRQATLLLCFSALGPLPNLGLIFRGTGKRVSKVEQAALAAAAPNVDVYWQPKAWSDRPVMQDWQKRTWKPFTEKHYPEGETYTIMAEKL